MRNQVVLLWTITALFIAFGAGFIFVPAPLAVLITGVVPASASALIDMRATYGGTCLGIGLFLGVCARHRDTVRLGLVASLSILSSIAGARLVGMYIDGSPNTFMLLLLAAEVSFVGLVVAALNQGSHSHPSGR